MIEVKYVDIDEDIKNYFKSKNLTVKHTRICCGYEKGEIKGAAAFDIAGRTLFIDGLRSEETFISDLILRAMLYRADFYGAADFCEITDTDLPEKMLSALNIKNGR